MWLAVTILHGSFFLLFDFSGWRDRALNRNEAERIEGEAELDLSLSRPYSKLDLLLSLPSDPRFQPLARCSHLHL